MTEVWRAIEEVPRSGPTAVTIGNFDGVHRGHQAVLSQMVADARARGQRSVALTFDPHPRAVHDPEHPPALITGLTDRLERMAATGLDGILVQHYTLDFAAQTPREFAQRYLVDGLGAATVVVGKDTRFGRANSGDVETMRELGAELGFAVEVIADVAARPGGERRWSSTWVRELLEQGDMAGAADVLGRPHRLRGVVGHGDKLGREIGFPTANVDVADGFVPLHGVYAGWLTVTDPRDSASSAGLVRRPFPAAISIGFNYTVGGTELRVEAHVLDGDHLDLYGAEVALDLVAYRRPMLDFGSIEALVVALGDDVEWTRGMLGPH